LIQLNAKGGELMNRVSRKVQQRAVRDFWNGDIKAMRSSTRLWPYCGRIVGHPEVSTACRPGEPIFPGCR
jgi:hypothetical protein